MQRIQTTLRHRVFVFLGLLILLCVVGSAWTLFRVGSVRQTLDGLRSGWIPLGKSLAQLATQSRAYQGQLERSLGYSQWNSSEPSSLGDFSSSAPFSLPRWIGESIREELKRTRTQLEKIQASELSDVRSELEKALNDLEKGLDKIESHSELLASSLVAGNFNRASTEYPKWNQELLSWVHSSQKMAADWDRLSKEVFYKTQASLDVLRSGLQLSLFCTVVLSFVLLWFAERALGPLSRLSFLAQEIKRRGVRREDKDLLAEFPIQRKDEVSDLAREFHSMATALLERERVVQEQTTRLESQNQELRELARLRERLRETENLAAIGRLSAQVAHEVRNPLHSIGLEAELASERATQMGDLKLRQSLQSILESVERLSSITENYLRFSRTSSGQTTRFDLGEALESVLAIYAPVCERQRIQVDWRRAPLASLTLNGDREGVEQALGNLMSNAIQALDGVQNPRIQWTLGVAETGSVWVRVRDNGPGISAEIRDRLFAPFSTTKAQGTGLGLSWVKRIVDEHSGSIEFQSNQDSSEYGGASFLLVFPRTSEWAQDRLQDDRGLYS